MTELGIKALHEKLVNGDVTSKDLTQEAINKAKKVQEKCNAFVTIIEDAKEEKVTDNMLSGIPYGVKDNYSTKGILSTGSSNTLKNYVPFFDATAVANLKKCGAVAVAKCAMDEFGMGGTGTTAHTGIIKNPWDVTCIASGSSSGSAASVASGVYPYALGSDTGDSIRKPAAFCGIVGYKPTYGMISRYGLFPFASSLDTCGVLSRSVEDAAIVVDAMKGLDEKDQTSWDSSNINLYKDLKKDNSSKLFYIKEICDINSYKNPTDTLVKHLENFKKTIEMARSLGFTIDEVSIDKELLNVIPSVYVCISCAEATSNMSNLTSISFGPRGEGASVTEMMKDYRTKGFSPLIKRRFVIGSFILQKENQKRYFLNAQRARRLIVDKFKNLFKTYDGLIMPVSSGPAIKIENAMDAITSSEISVLENHLQIANFGGFPSITIPNGFIDSLPVGVNITCNCYEDQKTLNIAYTLEGAMNYKDMVKGAYHD